MEPLNKTPAQLWVGSSLELVDAVERYLKTVFCPHQGCFTCTICLAVGQHQYHNLIWFNPSGNYTLEILKPFFVTISCALMANQNFYFVFQNADYLSNACSNSLLKSIEEPPLGYNFIFLAQHERALAPTIRSRCTVRVFEKKSEVHDNHPLVACFTTKLHDSDFFLQTLEKGAFDEHMTSLFLEHIINFWSLAYIKNSGDTQISQRIIALIECCKKAVKKPPMPGSGKIFWKNLFLQVMN